MPKGHALASKAEARLEDVANADFVSFKRDQARGFFDQTLNFCTDAGFSPTIRCEAGTVYGVLDMVAAGVGVAIVPASCAAAAGKNVAMRPLVRPARPGALVLVVRGVNRDPAVALLGTLMQKAFSELERLVREKLGR